MIPSTPYMSQAFTDYTHFTPTGKKPFSQDFNAVHTETGRQVLFKVIPMAELPHKENLGLEDELGRLQKLRSPYILSLLDHNVSHIGQDAYRVVVFDRFNGVPLSFIDAPLSAPTADPSVDKNLMFCRYAMAMTAAVRDFHAGGLQHRGLNPHEYLINTGKGEVKLNGFPWNHAWRPECRRMADQVHMPVVFPYIAPEQTGRMNLDVDQRSNLYSLGVVFYEMLTGQCPFPKNNSLETLYSHMTGDIKPPCLVAGDIHPKLSDLVMKLLAKSPDDRHPGIAEVRHDLKDIEKSLRQRTASPAFGGAGLDVFPALAMPKTLYGRQTALDTLINSYGHVCGGESCVVFVAGGPGVGKTELIRRFSQDVRESGGVFLSGKFDENQQDVPIKGPKTVLNRLVNWVLTQPPDDIRMWTMKIHDAVSPHGRVLTDLVPELEHLLGKQPPLKALTPMESNIRFTQVLETFISLFPSQEHPLVVFLDDLQWADKESLEYILAFLTSRKRHYCMGVGTYRDNDVIQTHPIAPYLARFQTIGIPCKTLTLDDLNRDDTLRLVVDTTGQLENEARPLARVVHKKTGGNPFLITQLLTSGHASGWIRYNVMKGCWDYDAIKASASHIPDNVATLLSDKITLLSRDTMDMLQAASCMGNRLDADLLCMIIDQNRPIMDEYLRQSIEAGVLREDVDAGGIMGERVLEFAHDHIKQAVYQTLPEDRARCLHLAIGRAMVTRRDGSTSMDDVFEIAHQFRQGLPYIVTEDEKINLVRLNLEAGQRAIERVSFEAALSYFRQAGDLLPENSWVSHYDLADTVYNWLAKSEFVLGYFETSEAHYRLLLDKAVRVRDKVRVYAAMVDLYASSGQIDKAMALGRSGLALLGIRFPSKPAPRHFIKHMISLRFKWNPGKINALINSPEVRDHEISMALSLLTALGQTAFYTDPRLALLLALKGGILAVSQKKRYFQDEHVTIEFNVLGAFFSQIPGFRGIGKEAAQMGMALLEHQAYGQSQVVGNYLAAVFNRHWYAPIRQSIIRLKRNYHHTYSAMDIGNSRHCINTMFLSRVFAVHSIDSLALTRFFLGDNLHDIFSYHTKQEDFVSRTRARLVIPYYKAISRFLSCLMGHAADPVNLDMVSCDPMFKHTNDAAPSDRLLMFFLLIFQLKLFVFYRQWDKALDLAFRIKKDALPPPGTLLHVAFHFYSYMAAAGVCYHMPDRPGKIHRKILMARTFGTMKRWARLHPENFGPLLGLMRAEKVRLSGSVRRAMVEYRLAIDLSRSLSMNHITALACEAAGNLLLNQDDILSASTYLNEAKKYYHLWGADAKVADMYTRYPDIMIKTLDDDAASPLDFMDFSSLVGALQTISREIEVKKLLSRLMRIVMKSACATHAVFMAHKEGELYVELECFGGEEMQDLHLSEPLDSRQGSLMAAVGDYVKRELSPVVLDDIHKESDFMEQALNDPRAPRALACLPMICKDKLVGILYLENAISSGVFPDGRMDILNMIASQAAISFENASLYEHVIEKEKHLTRISTKLRNLYSELRLTEERERSRIAIDLHDRIGHALALVKMNLAGMREQPWADHSALIKSSLSVVEQSIDDTRALSFEISPPILYDLGLGPALDWLCEEAGKKHGLPVHFDDRSDFEDEAPRAERETNILCFQVARELLSNAIKHARAQAIHVTLERDSGHINMSIEDDGTGFDLGGRHRTEKEEHKGFGLFSIKERLHLVNGHLDIASSPEQGTTISMSVPRVHPHTEKEKNRN